MDIPQNNRTQDLKPNDILDRAVQSLEQTVVPCGPPEYLLAATLAALAASHTQPKQPTSFLTRRTLMRSLLVTACAAMIAFAAIFLSQEFTSNSHAYADAVKQLKSARTMTYTNLVYVKGRAEPIRVKTFVAEDGRQRTEDESGIITIMDNQPRILLTLIPFTKTALVMSPSEGEAALATPKHSPRDWIESLAKLSEKPDKELGEQTLDGRVVIGFEASQGNYQFKIWLDATSKQIVRIEQDNPVKGAYLKSAMTDFEFDKPLDESLFSGEVPAGFRVTQLPAATVSNAPSLEESVVEALRGYSLKADGKFPKSITEWGEWAVLFSQGSTDGKLSPEVTQVMGHLGTILPSLSRMSKDDYAYLGDGKTAKDTDAIVFWYKNPEGKYRAVYGDLSVKEITPEKLPPSVEPLRK